MTVYSSPMSSNTMKYDFEVQLGETDESVGLSYHVWVTLE